MDTSSHGTKLRRSRNSNGKRSGNGDKMAAVTGRENGSPKGQTTISSSFSKQRKRSAGSGLGSKKAKNRRALASPAFPPARSPSPLTDDEKENKLREFDLDPTYGPCRGISRHERLERSLKLNLPVPLDIKLILDEDDSLSDFGKACIWDQQFSN